MTSKCVKKFLVSNNSFAGKKKHIELHVDCQRHLAQFSLVPKLSFAQEKIRPALATAN